MRIARLEKQSTSEVEEIANEVIRSITASYTKAKFSKSIRTSIGGYRDASLITEDDVVMSVDLPERALLLGKRSQNQIKNIVKKHLKFHESGSDGYHLLSKRATMSVSIRAENIFEGDNQYTRELMDNPATQLGYKGQLVAESSTSFNKLKEVNLTTDGKIEWVVVHHAKRNCVLKREYQ